MAVAQTQERLLTAEEFLNYPDRAGKQELVAGEVIQMAPANGEHGDQQSEFVVWMRPYAKRHGLGHVVVEVGFVLSRNPDTVRAPDVSFVTLQRFPNGLPGHFIDGPPDIAVEVVSPNDTHAEVMKKVGEYLDAGTRLVWVASR